MAFALPQTIQPPGEQAFRQKDPPGDQTEPLAVTVPARDPWRKRQKQLIQFPLVKELADEMRSTFHEEYVPAGEKAQKRVEYLTDCERLTVARRDNLDRGRNTLLSDFFFAYRGRDDRDRSLPRGKDRQRQVKRASGAHDNTHRRFLLPHPRPQRPVGSFQGREDKFRSPYMVRRLAQSSRANKYRIGGRPQQGHDHAVVPVRPAYLIAVAFAVNAERHDTVKCRHEVADHLRTASERGKLQTSIQGLQIVRKRQIDPAVVVDQNLEGSERDHRGGHNREHMTERQDPKGKERVTLPRKKDEAVPWRV